MAESKLREQAMDFSVDIVNLVKSLKSNKVKTAPKIRSVFCYFTITLTVLSGDIVAKVDWL